jgi:hypothetical protein
MDFCTRWEIPIQLDKTGDSEPSLSSEEEEGAESESDGLEEIVEESELEKFSNFLKEAQKAALELEKAKGKCRRTYTGRSRTTRYRRKTKGANLKAQGILGVFEYMDHIKSTRRPTVVFEEEEESSDNDSGPSGASQGTENYVQGHVSNSDTSDQEGSISGAPAMVASPCTPIHML